jgi:hypothetical protein
MDQDRTVDTLRDELGLEIERVLAIDPAPELKARVRARIESERRSRPSWIRWELLGAGALAMAMVAAIVVNRPEQEREPALPSEQVVAAPMVESVAAAPATPQVLSPAAQPVVSPARTTELEVLVAPGEAAALRLLVASIREGRIDPTVLDDFQPVGTPLQPLGEIAIQPIAIEPLARLELLEGERQ